MRIGWCQTANDRPEYQRQVTESWKKVRGFYELDARHIFLEPSAQHIEMEALAGGLGEVYTNPNKLGVLANPFSALTYMFGTQNCDFVILAEDDIVVSTDTIEYFKWAAEAYEPDQGIYGVCAFSRDGGSEEDVVLAKGLSSWVLGTWKSRWGRLMAPTWMSAATDTDDWSQIGWDWGQNRITKANNLSWITPKQSRSSHIGVHGTHSTAELHPGSVGVDYAPHREPVEYKLVR